ncbi:cytochrome c-type biogenesis protein [Pseudomonas sp. N040]|uniref:cytochrome c-type biogenesis protein n=1 Tax=Pseudomonas sp. N040 TaxID=2785325 RepID=UPI0018A28122|nr:cytochrome c-type biogenesis protein [Pseudomonas sp. N040]MBF7730837.1 cytochrome c-type biogenesis protein CcmH [Pseudomonas sp. N040]MBW7014480.1 cytochrome c-type biogenesis protein CcmH [Pseudomonas sp. N040]
MSGRVTGLLLGLLLAGSVHAAIDTYSFKDEAERQRFRQLTTELRCPKCQNQDIADSNAPIAADLRREIFRMLEEGKDNQQITDYLVARYGDFVRYKPALNSTTWLLWYGPAGMLLVGVLVLGLIVLRKRRVQSSAAATTLTADEQARLAALLGQNQRDKQD